MPRGGKRQGKQGTSYSERTDLNSNPSRTVAQPTPTPAPQNQAPTAPSQAGTTPNVSPQQQPLLAAHPNPPGSRGAFSRPTEMPSQPLTAGAPFGPGGGPSQLGLPNMQQQTLGSLLTFAAAQPGADPGIAYLASIAGRQM